MSGLVALYHPDGRPVEQPCLDKMTAALAHRGTDGSGLWCDGPIGLGHRMRRTTPESLHETLPLALPDKKLAITADARLDNRDELIAALNVADHAIPDSALILLAYDRWGEACPEKLLGDFAFVIWDGCRRVVFCARDHMGVKPFFYHHKPGQLFICASEIKALLCSTEVPRRLNEERVAEYLIPLQEDTAITFYRDVLRLPPGHRLVIDRAGLRLEPYWALDPTREIRLPSDEQYADAFRDLFTETVRSRLRSAVPVGSFLSGGLDSSSITCVARNLTVKHGGGPWKTFSAVFDDVPQCDERRFIQTVLDQGGVEPHYFHADRVGPLHELDRVHWHEDEAFYAPNLFINWGLYKLAQSQGVRVLLDGLDGDTTISHGMGLLTELALSGRWGKLAGEIVGVHRNGLYSGWTAFRRLVIPTLVPGPVRQIWRRLLGHALDGLPHNPTIRPEFAERIRLKERIGHLLRDRRLMHRSSRQEHYRRLTTGTVPFILELADRAAAAMAIEPRYPFFDRRLVEFCLALPAEQKLHLGWNRMILRRAMAGILPEAIRWRPRKTPLSQNFDRGVVTFEKRLLEEIILKCPAIIEPYIDIDALNMIYERNLNRPSHRDTLTVWKAATLGLWLRRVELQP